MLYLSQYTLSFTEARELRLTDGYSVHRVVYGLFKDVRGGNTQEHSGILFADKGCKDRKRRLWILSNRLPREVEKGELASKDLPLEYLQFAHYDFEVVVNPVRRDNQNGKMVPLRDREAVAQWFCAKAPSWGFAVHESSLLVADMAVDAFHKGGGLVTLGKATLTGSLHVTDREAFIASVSNGIGKGRAFGCGLLQIIPKQ